MQELTNQMMLLKEHVVSFLVLLFLFWSTNHICPSTELERSPIPFLQIVANE
jgi:hypothetical protein